MEKILGEEISSLFESLIGSETKAELLLLFRKNPKTICTLTSLAESIGKNPEEIQGDVAAFIKLGLLEEHAIEGKRILTFNQKKDVELQQVIASFYGKPKSFSLGSSLLNRLTGGGLPAPGFYLVEGDPGSGKTQLCMQFLYQGLREGDTALLISLDMLPGYAINTFRGLGWDITEYREKNRFLILDCLSGPAGLPTTEKYSLSATEDLSGLSILINKAVKELSELGRIRVAVITLSFLLQKTNLRAMLSFLRIQSARAKALNAAALVALNRRGFDDAMIADLEELSDGVIELRLKEGEDGSLRRFLRIKKLPSVDFDSRWTPFTIKEDEGFVGV